MGKERVFVFGKWRTVYYNKKGEYIFFTNSWKKYGGAIRGTKWYLKDIVNLNVFVR